jgi:type II secretory pathway pseudopilin PulG
MKNLLFNPSRLAIVSILLLAIPFRSIAQRDAAQRSAAQRDTAQRSAAQRTVAPAHIGFIYPISSNGKQAASITNRFSLHVIAGLSKEETGVAIAGVASVVKENAHGVHMAGVANVIGKDAGGVQLAGVANVTGNNAEGAQLAGFGNIVAHDAKGAQIAGFINLAENAGAVQIAGFTNIARKNVKGAQVAGFLNKAGDVKVQIGGFANVAKKVRGVQLAGLINIADSSDYPIAIFNFIKSGEKSVAITIDETLTGIISFRSGGRVLYGIAGIGYNFRNNAKAMYAAEGGLGAHIPLGAHTPPGSTSPARSLRINLEAVSQTLTDFDGGHYNKNSLRILPALKLGNRFEAFAGPTLNYVSYERENDYDFIKKYIWKNNSSKDFQGLFVGFNAGVQYIF